MGRHATGQGPRSPETIPSRFGRIMAEIGKLRGAGASLLRARETEESAATRGKPGRRDGRQGMADSRGCGSQGMGNVSPQTWITADSKISTHGLGSPLSAGADVVSAGGPWLRWLMTLPSSFRSDRNEVSVAPTVTTTNASPCEVSEPFPSLGLQG